MEQSGSGHSSVTGSGARTVALEFDLNKTPPASPQEETAGGNDDGATADLRCASCRHTQGEMVVCVVCVKHFHVECLGGSVEESEWKCAECSTECRRRKRLRRSELTGSGGGRLVLLDMNASPPPEVDGDDVEVHVNSDLAMTDSETKMQDTCDNPLLGCTSTSSNTHNDIRIARLNLDIATLKANSVYLQALKDYISERRGVLGDGWRVRFEYLESNCKNFPIYCAPDGSRFDSMPKVAHYLGLLSASCSLETNGNDSSIELLQNGSRATKNLADSSRSLSRVINGGNAVEVDPNENGNCGTEPFLDGFPVQFEDFLVTSIGKIDPHLPFHNASQIWPIGYESMWHDKLTGSIFVCNVLKAGDCGPKFRVNRYPCTKRSLPKASTIIYKPQCGPSSEITSCLTSESFISLQRCQHMPSDNFINDDAIGEFSVEGRSPSSAWQMVLETLLFSCHQSFQDLKSLSFCCNHRIESQNFYGSYGIDSLDKFGYLTGQTSSIPCLVLTVDQLEVFCMMLRRWLQPDRFGLDAEFVQELIEKLPEASTCSEYKYLDARCKAPLSHTVKSGFFTVLKKYHSQPMVSSDSLTETRKMLCPPGNAIVSKLPPALIGNVLQVYEFFLRFHKILGQEAPLSRQKLEYELLNPWVNDLNSPNSGSMKSCEKSHKIQDHTSCSTIAPDAKTHDEICADATKGSDGVGCESQLSSYHMAILKVLVEDMLAKVKIYDPSSAMESKSRKLRKKYVDLNVFDKRVKNSIFPINEITWPEMARRFILVLLSMDDNLGDLDITSREFNEVFHCLNGSGGLLCGSLTGMAAIEADAVVLAEALMTVFSSVKSRLAEFFIDKDLIMNNSAMEKKTVDNKCPEWIEILEPVRKQATNVGAKIRNLVRQSLQKRPPAWAKTMLHKSISKDVYKGNAAGATKRIVVEVLHRVRNENPLTKKKAKESRVLKTVSDVIMKRCRMVLRSVASEEENKAFFNLMSESLLKPNESNDDEHPATISRLLDFRTIDLRLDSGSYHSHESFIEDVREVWHNLRIIYRNKREFLDLIEKISERIEDLYEQEVLALVSKITECWNRSDSSFDETKTEINLMLADTISSTLFVAPWEDGICKICGKDENDHILLLCDRCDAEYHTYCLDPPLQRVPKSSWYCPPCISFITSHTMPQEEDFESRVSSQTPLKKTGQREVTQNGLEELADLANSMESTEYWELGLEKRVFLLQWLCDEALSSTTIRDHISSENTDIKRNFLGQDSAGRLYWVLGQPERLFISGPHSEAEVCVASESSTSREFDSWICYELDAEVEALVEWLKDDDAREKQLKEKITNWQRNKSNNHNSQVDLHVDLRSTVNATNARAELKKKFGSLLEGKIPCLRNGVGKIVHEGKIYRCDCLELVGPNRQHCFSCHTSFFTKEVHYCTQRTSTLTNGLVGSNWNPSFVPENPPQNRDAAFLFKQLFKSNSSISEAGGSNPDGVIENNPSSSRSLDSRVSEIILFLKMILFDIEFALPEEAFRPSRVDPHRLRCWRAFLKSTQSIYEMVEATIVLEDMIKTEYLKKEWWYWSSPSTAAKISTTSSLALQIYALDAAIFYGKPPLPPVDLTESVAPEDYKSKEESPKKSNPSSSTTTATLNDSEPSKTPRSKDKLMKKKLKFSSD